MRIPRIYHPGDITPGSELALTDEASGHVGRVLRMKAGDMLTLFNGQNLTFAAVITHADKKNVKVRAESMQHQNNESPLHLHLGQVISRGEKMEFTIQKAVELGVSVITPLCSERCGVRLDSERQAKKIQQWQKIVINACEQCGRNFVPSVQPITTLAAWCNQPESGLKLNLNPQGRISINTLPSSVTRLRLLIGPEGGLSDEEITLAARKDFTDIILGPRVLRTETTALAALAALQLRFGDLG